ncbi:MAG TPA: 2-dehydro-3-deoxyphosphogluconate aldolase [Thermoanaerobaculia bacterium]|nr:2-dehydro-3-deoxyphosphogluconate aldolase [Thermoanaerobaculia bacterium]
MPQSSEQSTKAGIAASVHSHPVMSVVRTETTEEAGRHARLFRSGGIELIEITFSVPGATGLVRELLSQRSGDGPPFIGMGTVTDGERARQAVAAGAEFIVSPNVSAAVAEVALAAGRYLVLGALSPTEIVTARELGSDLVKVYPLPPVGGPRYLSTVRQPLGDIPMLAGGGFEVDEIPAYRAAGASAFGIGAPLLADSEQASLARIARALTLARGGEP